MIHPAGNRRLSIPELQALASYPSAFMFQGGYKDRWERIGNSVPPKFMFHIAAHIRDTILTTGNVATLEATGEAFPVVNTL